MARAVETAPRSDAPETGAASHDSAVALDPAAQQRRKARAAGGPFAASIALISDVAKVPKKTVRAMCARDFLAAVGYFNGFQIGRRPGSDD